MGEHVPRGSITRRVNCCLLIDVPSLRRTLLGSAPTPNRPPSGPLATQPVVPRTRGYLWRRPSDRAPETALARDAHGAASPSLQLKALAVWELYGRGPHQVSPT